MLVKSTAVALMLLTAAAQAALSGPYQQQQQRRTVAPSAAAVRTENSTMRRFGFEVMKKAEELPGVPPVPGSPKFLYGQLKRDNGSGAVGLSERFAVQADPKALIPYYKTGLEQYRWKILNKNDYSVSARNKNGDICNLQVMPSHTPGYMSELYVSLDMKR